MSTAILSVICLWLSVALLCGLLCARSELKNSERTLRTDQMLQYCGKKNIAVNVIDNRQHTKKYGREVVPENFSNVSYPSYPSLKKTAIKYQDRSFL